MLVRYCHATENYSVTTMANTSFLLQGVDNLPVAPFAAHGVITNYPDEDKTYYTPDPCFSGRDHFGYDEFLDDVDGTVTVTVVPGACGVVVLHGVDCATGSVIYAAMNPYTLPAKVSWSGKATGSVSVPAGKTVTLLKSSTGGAGRLSFRLPEANQTLLVDDVSSLCPRSQADAHSHADALSQAEALASTGSSTGAIGVTAGLLLFAGLGLVVTGRRRRV